MPKSNHPKFNILRHGDGEEEGAEEDTIVIDASLPEGNLESQQDLDLSEGGDVFDQVEARIRTRYTGLRVQADPIAGFKQQYNKLVHIIVPIVMSLVVGLEMAFIVIGQHFLVDVAHILGLIAAVVSVMAVEAVGLSITFQISNVREEKQQETVRGHALRKLYPALRRWRIGLTVVEGLGQAAFLGILFEADGVNMADLKTSWVYLFLVLVRTLGLFVSDFYPAFLYVDPPTTAQQQLAEDKMQNDAIADAYKVTEENLRVKTRARLEMLDAVNREKEKVMDAKYAMRDKERALAARERRERNFELQEEEDQQILLEEKAKNRQRRRLTHGED